MIENAIDGIHPSRYESLQIKFERTHVYKKGIVTMLSEQGSIVSRRPAFFLWGLATLYLLFNQVIIYCLFPTASLDQAEQLVLAQDFFWGYNAQPPLYTWIVKTLFLFFGPSLGILLFLKTCVLSALVGIILRISVYMGYSFPQQILLFCIIALIPDITWEGQRDLTHSPLVVLFSTAVFMQIIATTKNDSWTNYILLGIYCGCGLLAKYNFIIFLFSIILTIPFSSYLKSALINKKTIVTIIVFLGIILPHALWLLNYSSLIDTKKELRIEDNSFIGASLSLFYSWCTLIAPVLLLGWPILKNILSNKNVWDIYDRTIIYFLIISYLVIEAFVVLTRAGDIESRWLLPILIFVPIILSKNAQYKSYTYKAIVVSGLFFLALVTVGIPGRILLSSYIGNPKPVYIESAAMADALVKVDESAKTIVTETRIVAGNIKRYYPDIRVVSLDQPIQNQRIDRPLLAVCSKNNCKDSPIRPFLEDHMIFLSEDQVAKKVNIPYRYIRNIPYTVYVYSIK